MLPTFKLNDIFVNLNIYQFILNFTMLIYLLLRIFFPVMDFFLCLKIKKIEILMEIEVQSTENNLLCIFLRVLLNLFMFGLDQDYI